MAEGTLGFLMEGMFYPSWGAGCFGSFEFLPPSASIVISPSVATVGDSVIITWGSNNAVACYFDNAPIALSGVHTFAAALSDARAYTLECQNPWGWASDTATLVVNEPEPNCPAVPIGIDSMVYPVVFGTDPGPDNIGRFSRVGNPSVISEAFCTGSEWKLRIVGAQHTVKIDVNLSNMGNGQIDNGVIDSANCAALETMKTSLETKAASVTASFGGWYDEGAVIAHEHVHRERYEAEVNTLFAIAKTGIESISIPLSAASNQAAAYAQLTGTSTPYSGILLNLSSEAATAYSFLNHSNPMDFMSVQQQAVEPFITRINERLSTCQ